MRTKTNSLWILLQVNIHPTGQDIWTAAQMNTQSRPPSSHILLGRAPANSALERTSACYSASVELLASCGPKPLSFKRCAATVSQ